MESMMNVGGISYADRDNVQGWAECRESAWMHVVIVRGLFRAFEIATSKLVPPTGDHK